MLKLYRAGMRGLEPIGAIAAGEPLPADVVWIDLFSPTPEEEAGVQAWLGIDIPTREEMREIEVSSRLYEGEGALYMTVQALVGSETGSPATTDVTFILSRARLVTVRYAEPKAMAIYVARAPRLGPACAHGEYVLAGIIEALIDRVADILERAGLEIDQASHAVFGHTSTSPTRVRDFRSVIERLGRTGDLVSKTRESLVTIARLLMFLSSANTGAKSAKEARPHLKSALRDANQLSDHASFLSSKIAFLFDATMGLISIEQNNIIKLFSVVAVTLMPPTLIASVYGMNFDHMPELHFAWAYPLVLIAMVASAILPYVYFRRKGWL